MAWTLPIMPTNGAATPFSAQFQRLVPGVAVEAAVAGGAFASRVDDRDLAFEADGGAGHQGRLRGDAGGIDRVARGEVVGAVEHDVRLRHRIVKFGTFEAPGDRRYPGVRVQGGDARGGRLDLGAIEGRVVVDDLPLQVREVHGVVVHQRQSADPRGGEVEGHRRTESAEADDQRMGIQKRLLPTDVELAEHDLAAVSEQLFVGHDVFPYQRPRVTRGRFAKSRWTRMSTKPRSSNSIATASPCSSPCSRQSQPPGVR